MQNEKAWTGLCREVNVPYSWFHHSNPQQMHNPPGISASLPGLGILIHPSHQSSISSLLSQTLPQPEEKTSSKSFCHIWGLMWPQSEGEALVNFPSGPFLHTASLLSILAFPLGSLCTPENTYAHAHTQILGEKMMFKVLKKVGERACSSLKNIPGRGNSQGRALETELFEAFVRNFKEQNEWEE